MDTEKHIEILKQELDFCYDIVNKVSWEQRLHVDALILMLWKQLQRECRISSLHKEKLERQKEVMN